MATLITVAQYHMTTGDHMDGLWPWGAMALMLLAFVAVIGFAIWFVRSPNMYGPSAPETPMQILDRRLAQGEIAQEEYKERVAVLGKG